MRWRRNADERLRRLERRWAEGDIPCAEIVHGRLRAGVIPRYGVVASMLLGNECAREALELPPLPKITADWPWGHVVSNHWMGPWPGRFNQVRYEGQRLVIAGSEPGPIGSLLDAMSRLGEPEYFLAFAAEAVRYAASTHFAMWRGDHEPIALVVNAALEHAEQMAVYGTGDQAPGTHAFLQNEVTESELRAAQAHGYEGEAEEVWSSVAALAAATSSGPADEMIQRAIDAMAHAANVVLGPQWESVYWESLWGEGRARSDAGQWVRANELLEGLYRDVDERLSPWLLGFRPGPLDHPLEG
jgi:hypothetical protein